MNGSDEQVYEPAFDEVVGYTNFNAGDFNVSPGTSQTGAVVFTVPSGHQRSCTMKILYKF